MLDWYLGTHAWNRIALTGLIVATITKGPAGTLTLAHVIALPIGAVTFWALGWAAIGTWRVLNRRRHTHPSAAAGAA